MFFCIACNVSNIHLIQMSYSPHFSTPAFHSPSHTPGPHIAFVNFTILNIHACFPFSYGWMVEEKKRQRMCVDVSFLPHLAPFEWGFHVLQKMGFNMYTYSFARMWNILQQQL